MIEYSILNTQQIEWGRNAPRPELKGKLEDKPTVSVILYRARIKSFPLRLRMALEVLARAIRQEKRNKKHLKMKSDIVLFIDNMIMSLDDC